MSVINYYISYGPVVVIRIQISQELLSFSWCKLLESLFASSIFTMTWFLWSKALGQENTGSLVSIRSGRFQHNSGQQKKVRLFVDEIDIGE